MAMERQGPASPWRACLPVEQRKLGWCIIVDNYITLIKLPVIIFSKQFSCFWVILKI
jgi:hypothetical protein